MLFTVASNHNNKYIPLTFDVIPEFDKNVTHELKRLRRAQDQSLSKGTISLRFVFCTPAAVSRSDSWTCVSGVPLDPM